MKMVIIAYNEAVDEEITEILKFNSQVEFTKWTKVLGQGKNSEPHLMTNIWPKANNVLMACVGDDSAKKILDGIRELRKTMGHEGVKAFSLPVDDAT